MTTTTDKRTGRLGATLPRLAPLAAAALLLAGECRADWRTQPSVTLNETYTDNAGLQSDDLKYSQLISELTPALAFTGAGRRYKVAGSVQWRQFAYSGEQPSNALDHSLEYAVNGQGTLVDDLLFVDASASVTPQSISAFGPRVESTPYIAENRAEIKTWRIGPRLEHRFGNTANLSMRYTRDSVDSGDFDAFGSSVGDTFIASLTSGKASQTWGWGLTALRQELDGDLTGETSTETLEANLRYSLNRRFALTASAGYDSYDYQALGGRTAGRNWSAGFDWTPSARTRLSAELGRHFYGQTGRLDVSHRSRHTVWSINYGDSVTTSRQQFLLPSTIDTAALLDNLFAATISDPVLRQQAVANYIRTAGLPNSLAESINYLTNRYIRQKQLQASVAYTRARSTALLSLFRTESIALSSQQSDSPLLGSQLSNLNDNVLQHGVNTSYTYRITPRSSLVAAASLTRSRSISADFEDERRDLRIGYTRQLGRSLRATLELRHLQGSYGVNAGSYRENAISASLSAQL